jgi:acyl carrier protein
MPTSEAARNVTDRENERYRRKRFCCARPALDASRRSVLHTAQSGGLGKGWAASKDERSGMQGESEFQLAETAAAELELEVKEMIVRAARLAPMKAHEIDSDAALFNDGLGLDSLDAIQIAVALEESYGVGLTADDDENRRRLSSVRSIAELIREQVPSKRAPR